MDRTDIETESMSLPQEVPEQADYTNGTVETLLVT